MFIALAATLDDAAAGQPGDTTRELLSAYIAGVNARTPMRLVELDNQLSMDFFGLRAVADSQPLTVIRVIEGIRDDLHRHGDPLDGVLLVGGDEAFPFWRFGNPVS